MPFSINNSYYSHSCKNQGARWQTYVSMACLCGCSVSRLGLPVPILALKSPHMNVTSWGWRMSNTFSSLVVAWDSSMRRLVSEVVGGIYTLTMLIR
jgi:hypothetical protein